MPKDLESVICCINNRFINFCTLWEKSSSYKRVNLKKKSVKDATEGSDVLKAIYAYRSFLSGKIVGLEMLFNEKIIGDSRIFTRLKTPNSIKDKITKYTKWKKEKGGVPICKCLNDIFGVRIIQSNAVNTEQIIDILKEHSINSKCIDSSKGYYNAIHVYFQNTNFDFPWELQIWEKRNEENNTKSHAKYKQDYTEWVKERGISNG